MTRNLNWSHRCGDNVARVRPGATCFMETSDPTALKRMRFSSSMVTRRLSLHHLSNASKPPLCFHSARASGASSWSHIN